METHKTCLVFAAIVSALIFQVHAGWIEDLNECTSKFTVSPSDLQLLNQRQTPTSREGKCVLACLMKKVGIMNEKGKFSVEHFKNMAPKVHMGNEQQINLSNKLADGCNTEIPTNLDECDTAAKIDECISRKAKELGLAPPPQPPQMG